MEIKWLKVTPSLSKGIVIINSFDTNKCNQLVKRIAVKLKSTEPKLFSDQETEKLEKIFNIDSENLTLGIKTIVYLLKRMSKYVFKPVCLKNDLTAAGLNEEKADLFINVWSNDLKAIFEEIGDSSNKELNVSWNLRAELSNEYQKNVKIPKAYISLLTENSDLMLELTHPELYSMFLQFEAMQTELDMIM